MHPSGLRWTAAHTNCRSGLKGLLGLVAALGAVTLLAGPPAHVVLLSGAGQTTNQGSPFASPLQVTVTDAASVPLAGVTVTFSGTGLAFYNAGGVTVTSSGGVASMTAIALTAGALTATATVQGVDPLGLPLQADPLGTPARFLYWSHYENSGGLNRLPFGGGTPDIAWIQGAGINPAGIAVDDTFIYWANPNGYVGRATRDNAPAGLNPYWLDVKSLTTGAKPLALALDPGHIYWADEGLNGLGRASLDGSGVQTQWLSRAAIDPSGTPTATPMSVAVNGTHVYWADPARELIGRALLNGEATPTTITSDFFDLHNIEQPSHPAGSHYVTAVALDAVNLYWGDYVAGAIGRIPIDGVMGVDEQWNFVTDAVHIRSLCVADQLYWGGDAALGQAPLVRVDGTSAALVDDSGFNTYYGIAVSPAGPTVITLASFTARPQGQGVALAWQTGSEVDTVGFNVWRSATASGSHAKITGALIPAQGTGLSGASYAWTDTAVTVGQTWFYQLEDIDTKGVSTFHGPVSATVSGKPFGLTDLAGLSLAWGSVKGQPAYNPCYDLNGDGKVDDADVALCFKGL